MSTNRFCPSQTPSQRLVPTRIASQPLFPVLVTAFETTCKAPGQPTSPLKRNPHRHHQKKFCGVLHKLVDINGGLFVVQEEKIFWLVAPSPDANPHFRQTALLAAVWQVRQFGGLDTMYEHRGPGVENSTPSNGGAPPPPRQCPCTEKWTHVDIQLLVYGSHFTAGSAQPQSISVCAQQAVQMHAMSKEAPNSAKTGQAWPMCTRMEPPNCMDASNSKTCGPQRSRT